MHPNLHVLTVTNIGETEADNARVTLSAMNIKMCVAVEGEAQGRPVKVTTIFFMGEGSNNGIELTLSELDLMQIESAVGTYGFVTE